MAAVYVVRNLDNVTINLVELEENSDWSAPEGCRLEDAKSYVPDYGPVAKLDDL